MPSSSVFTFKFLRSCGVSAPRACLMIFRLVQCPMGDVSLTDELDDEALLHSTVLHQHVSDTRCRYFVAGGCSLVVIYSPMFNLALFYIVVYQHGSLHDTGIGEETINDPLKEASWDTCNCLLIAWIMHNVEQPIKRYVMYTRTAKEIWDYLQKQFYHLEIMSDWPPFTQVTPEVNAWLNAQIKEHDERKLFQFLNGLNLSYSIMKRNVLMMSPLPTMEEAKEADGDPKCPVCTRKGHAKAQCWKVIGYPADHLMSKKYPEKSQGLGSSSKGFKLGAHKGKHNNYPRHGKDANDAMGDGFVDMEGNMTLTTQQFEQLMSNNKGKGASSHPETEDEMEVNFEGMAGMACMTCCYASNSSHEWIRDSGALDHMISNLNILENLPNGETTTVSHMGSYRFVNEGDIKKYILSKGIWQQNSCVDTQQQNGMVERKHIHILEISRALRLPTEVLENKTPYDILFHKNSQYDQKRVFGCLVMVHNPSRKKDKFQARGIPCVFLGYPLSQKGYRVYGIVKKTVFVSRDVRFLEDVFSYKINNFSQFLPSLQAVDRPTSISQPANDISTLIEPDVPPVASPDPLTHIDQVEMSQEPEPSSENDNVLEPHTRSTRIKTAPEWTKDYVVHNPVMAPSTIANLVQLHLPQPFARHVTTYLLEPDPNTFQEAA
ncbi:uncharacterized protein LOC141613192 [Silene latifolia]|uniref:uncharacterized protein LOC141613192 n=1 Tax=Silene latifolia TaxID=37657 RepID=UPI003D787F89